MVKYYIKNTFNKLTSFVLTFVLIFLSVCSTSVSVTETPVNLKGISEGSTIELGDKIKWESVAGADYYQVKLKSFDSNSIVADEIIRGKTSYTFPKELGIGNVKHRFWIAAYKDGNSLPIAQIPNICPIDNQRGITLNVTYIDIDVDLDTNDVVTPGFCIDWDSISDVDYYVVKIRDYSKSRSTPPDSYEVTKSEFTLPSKYQDGKYRVYIAGYMTYNRKDIQIAATLTESPTDGNMGVDFEVKTPVQMTKFSGKVAKDDGSGLQGVAIGFSINSGTGNTPSAVVTDSNGNWEQVGFSKDCKYTVTPQKSGYTFSPYALSDIWGNNSSTGINFTGTPNDTVSPTVVGTATTSNYVIQGDFYIEFSEKIYAGTNYSNITVEKSGNVEGNVKTEIANNRLVFSRTSYYWAYNTTYTITVPAGAIKDLAGNQFNNPYIISFTTEKETITPTPTVKPVATPTPIQASTPTVTPMSMEVPDIIYPYEGTTISKYTDSVEFSWTAVTGAWYYITVRNTSGNTVYNYDNNYISNNYIDIPTSVFEAYKSYYVFVTAQTSTGSTTSNIVNFTSYGNPISVEVPVMIYPYEGATISKDTDSVQFNWTAVSDAWYYITIRETTGITVYNYDNYYINNTYINIPANVFEDGKSYYVFVTAQTSVGEWTSSTIYFSVSKRYWVNVSTTKENLMILAQMYPNVFTYNITINDVFDEQFNNCLVDFAQKYNLVGKYATIEELYDYVHKAVAGELPLNNIEYRISALLGSGTWSDSGITIKKGTQLRLICYANGYFGSFVSNVSYEATQNADKVRISGSYVSPNTVFENTLVNIQAKINGEIVVAGFPIYVQQNYSGYLVEVQAYKTYIKVDGVTKKIDVNNPKAAPKIYNNRTYVPIRTIIQSIGGAVHWYPSDNKVTVILGDKYVDMWQNTNKMVVNGVETTIEAKILVDNNNTMVPLKAVFEGLGCVVEWNPKSKNIFINYDPATNGKYSNDIDVSNVNIQADINKIQMNFNVDPTYAIISFRYSKNDSADKMPYPVEDKGNGEREVFIPGDLEENTLYTIYIYSEDVSGVQKLVYSQDVKTESWAEHLGSNWVSFSNGIGEAIKGTFDYMIDLKNDFWGTINNSIQDSFRGIVVVVNGVGYVCTNFEDAKGKFDEYINSVNATEEMNKVVGATVGSIVISDGMGNIAKVSLKKFKDVADTSALMKNVTKTITSVKSLLKTDVDRIFEKVQSVYRNGDELTITTPEGLEFNLSRTELKTEIKASGLSDDVAERKLKTLEEGCFSGDTEVLTKDGYKKISNIQKGELVFAKDVITGKTGYKTVKQIYIKSTKEFILLNVDGEEIKTTASHLFFTDFGWWKAVENIKQGEKIYTASGELKEVISVETVVLQTPELIYNLNVEDYHTYFVSESSLLVHNNCTEEMTNAIRSADTAGIKLILKSGYKTHLTDVVEFTQSAGIKGGHNKTKFFEYLNNNGILINEISRTPHPSINGVEVIKYQIPTIDAAGNIIRDVSGNIIWKSTQLEKTIFDPNIISETQMIEMGEQAMKEGLDALRLTPQTNSNTIINGVAPNGLKFTGYWNPTTGLIENFHPVL